MGPLRGMDSLLLLLCWMLTDCAGFLLTGPHSLCTLLPKETDTNLGLNTPGRNVHFETLQILLNCTGAWQTGLILAGGVTDVYTKAISAAKPIISDFCVYSMCSLRSSSYTSQPQDGAVVSQMIQEGWCKLSNKHLRAVYSQQITIRDRKLHVKIKTLWMIMMDKDFLVWVNESRPEE